MADSSSKGNPAQHRMGNANLKARRARSWSLAERRKAARRAAQDAREKVNARLREAGLPVPFDGRAARRHPDLVDTARSLGAAVPATDLETR